MTLISNRYCKAAVTLIEEKRSSLDLVFCSIKKTIK
jgi:hypothetical protein